MRFERGVDPEAASVGADRACRLMAEWCGAPRARGRDRGGSRAGAAARHDACEPGVEGDRLRRSRRRTRPRSSTGCMMPSDGRRATTSTVEVPGYRVDIEREVDLIEEVVRVQGYDRVGSTLPADAPAGRAARMLRVPPPRPRLADARAGLREVWLVPVRVRRGPRADGRHRCDPRDEPAPGGRRWLRTRLTPGLLKAIRRNAYRQVRERRAVRGRARVFRHGRRRARGAAQGGVRAHRDRRERAGPDGREFDFFDAKGVVEALMADLGIAWTLGEPARARRSTRDARRSSWSTARGSASSARSTRGWRSRSTSRAASPWPSSRSTR